MDVYEIRVQGRLDQHWASWFAGLTLAYEGDCTTLRGRFADEAALYGTLAKVRDLHIRLIAVQLLEGAESDTESDSESATTAERAAEGSGDMYPAASGDDPAQNAQRKGAHGRQRRASP